MQGCFDQEIAIGLMTAPKFVVSELMGRTWDQIIFVSYSGIIFHTPQGNFLNILHFMKFAFF